MPSDPSIPADFAMLAALVAPVSGEQVGFSTVTGFAANPGSDWDGLLRLAERHRVIPALAAAIERSQLEVPSHTMARLKAGAEKSAFDELAQAALLRDIAASFQQRSITLVILKGVPLSLRLHGRLGLRVSRDIDLLVAPSDVNCAIDVLVGMGFRVRSDHDLARPKALRAHMRLHKDVELVHDGLRQVVELHWRLFDNLHLMTLPPDVPKHTVTLPSGVASAVLPDRLNILYLANHGTQHGWSRLKWLIDFAALIAPLGGEGIADFYDSVPVAEGRRSMAQALILCAKLFGWPLPEQVDADRRQDWRIVALVRIALRSMTRSGAREMEDVPFGSTAKNIGHYLIRSSPRYLLAEMLFDLADVSALPAQSPWRRWGVLGRLAAWIGGQGSRKSPTP